MFQFRVVEFVHVPHVTGIYCTSTKMKSLQETSQLLLRRSVLVLNGEIRAHRHPALLDVATGPNNNNKKNYWNSNSLNPFPSFRPEIDKKWLWRPCTDCLKYRWMLVRMVHWSQLDSCQWLNGSYPDTIQSWSMNHTIRSTTRLENECVCVGTSLADRHPRITDVNRAVTQSR